MKSRMWNAKLSHSKDIVEIAQFMELATDLVVGQ